MSNKKIKIGFDAKRLFHNKEGLGSYARTLVATFKEFYPEYDMYLFTPELSNNGIGEAFKNNEDYQICTASNRKSYWRARGMVKDLKRLNIDIYFGLSNELPYGIENSGIKTVVTIHDLIFKNFKSQFSWLDRQIYQRKFKHAIYQSDVIIAPSQSTRRDILKAYNVDESKIEVLYQSINPKFYKLKAEEKVPKHFLFVGTLNERKNLMLVVKAIHRLKEEERPLVVVVGEGKSYKEKVLKYIKKNDLSQYFDFRGNIPTDTLTQLYQEAYALIFPSKYEGFGIPVIEALTVGIPVVVGDSTSLPEVVGQHGIVIDYNDVEALSTAIVHLSKKKNRQALLQGIKTHLNAFNPKSICSKLNDIIKSV